MSESGKPKIEIKLDELREEKLSNAKRPVGALEGAAHPGVVPIYVDSGVIESTWQHVRTNPYTEIGGVLIGKCADDGGLFTHIFDSLEARHTATTAGSLTFTHETWADISDRMSYLPQDAKIAGWYHSHPGHGIFMSGKDVFIHNNFFRTNWQCALVLDPIKNEEGLFQIVDNQVVRSGFWRVGGRSSAHRTNSTPSIVVDVSLEQDPLVEAGEHFNEALDHVNDAIDKLGEYAKEKAVHFRSPLGRHLDKRA